MEKQKICILGLGYIGLPTAAMFATHGHRIIGVDVRAEVVEALNRGAVTIAEPYLDIMVQAAVTSGNLKGSASPEAADVFIIAVPTPITPDKKADLTCVTAAANAIVPYLREGNLVVLESTSPLGTVRELICPIIAKSGLKIGEQLYVVHSPERVLPGKILIELVENNRIVGGINQKSAELGRDLYRTFVKGEIFLTDATTAELCKMMENTYRDVNIALANQLAVICEQAGINAWEVIRLCNKHPRVNLHQPGPGVGGHCLAVDPWFIVERFGETADLIELSRQINDRMPLHLVKRIEAILHEVAGLKTVTILGITYKADVDDIRQSPIIDLVELLKQKKYRVNLYDPFVKNYPGLTKELLPAVTGSDLIVLGVGHSRFAKLDLTAMAKVMRHARLLDTRNFYQQAQLVNAGFEYHLLGNKC